MFAIGSTAERQTQLPTADAVEKDTAATAASPSESESSTYNTSEDSASSVSSSDYNVTH